MDSNKRRKKTKQGTCEYCKIDFLQYNYQKKEFCSKECFSIINNKHGGISVNAF